MQIAILSLHTSPLARLGGKEAGGMNVYVREQARELGRRGVLVDIFTRSQAPDVPPQVALAPGVQVISLPAGPLAPYDKNAILAHLDAFVAGVQQFAANHARDYALIHSHYWVSGAAALRLRPHWQVPVVQMFHTLGALKNRVARSTEETETSARIALERQLLHEVDAVVAATPLDRAHMIEQYGADGAHIHVIPCGVDTALFRPQPQDAARAHLGLPTAPRLLLGLGRMEPLKGLDALIEALALLRRSQAAGAADLRVLLVGGEPEERPAQWNAEQRRLANLRDSLGLDDAVIFAGAQPQTLLPSYYAAADVFVMPSHYESFGLAALEALACGTPVVASNAGGLAFIIEDGRSGLLVPPNDPPALAAQLERVLGDAALWQRLHMGGLQRAATYSWARVVDSLDQLYARLLV